MMGLLEGISTRRRASSGGVIDCSVIAVWAMNGRSRVDIFDNIDLAPPPYGYALVSTTTGLGCCYADEFLEVPADWIGRDSRSIITDLIEWEVALLDAIPPTHLLIPTNTFSTDAQPSTKVRWRAEIIVNTITSVIERDSVRKPIVMLGAVGSFIQSLSSAGYQVKVGDLHPALVGQTVGGISVRHLAEIEAEIAPESIILLTGMAIANNTLDRLLQLRRTLGAFLILYGQSGMSFASDYIIGGVDCVIDEKFPFYTMDGISRIEIYWNRFHTS